MIVINETWRLAPWADLLYACDQRWWRDRGPKPDEFAGMRVQGHIGPKGYLAPGCIHGGVDSKSSQMVFRGYRLGAGGNSGFQALNLAARTGAKRIVLLGYDFDYEDRPHWHPDHTGALTNPPRAFLNRCATILDGQAIALKATGIEVLNASRASRLKAYRKVSIGEALS